MRRLSQSQPHRFLKLVCDSAVIIGELLACGRGSQARLPTRGLTVAFDCFDFRCKPATSHAPSMTPLAWSKLTLVGKYGASGAMAHSIRFMFGWQFLHVFLMVLYVCVCVSSVCGRSRLLSVAWCRRAWLYRAVASMCGTDVWSRCAPTFHVYIPHRPAPGPRTGILDDGRSTSALASRAYLWPGSAPESSWGTRVAGPLPWGRVAATSLAPGRGWSRCA